MKTLEEVHNETMLRAIDEGRGDAIEIAKLAGCSERKVHAFIAEIVQFSAISHGYGNKKHLPGGYRYGEIART